MGFELAGCDSKRLLIIDPVLGYSTYLGGAELTMAKASQWTVRATPTSQALPFLTVPDQAKLTYNTSFTLVVQ